MSLSYIYIDQFSGRLLSFDDFVIVIFQIRNHNQNTKKLSILFLFLKIKNPQKICKLKINKYNQQYIYSIFILQQFHPFHNHFQKKKNSF